MPRAELTADGVHVFITAEPLFEAELLPIVQGPDIGAVVTFRGTVRGNARDQAVDHLDYEAYTDMALVRLQDLGRRARTNWPGLRLAVAHRIGRLEVGEVSVIVVAGTPHRAEAFEACAWFMDRLKADVPIWKRETVADGSYWVEGPGGAEGGRAAT